MDQSPDRQISSIAEPGVKAEGQLLYAMRKEVADLLGRHQTSFPGAQPVSFARPHLHELTRQEYVGGAAPIPSPLQEAKDLSGRRC